MVLWTYVDPKWKSLPGNLATLEHLDSKLSGRRRQRHDGAQRIVLACRRCNQAQANGEIERLTPTERERRNHPNGRVPRPSTTEIARRKRAHKERAGSPRGHEARSAAKEEHTQDRQVCVRGKDMQKGRRGTSTGWKKRSTESAKDRDAGARSAARAQGDGAGARGLGQRQRHCLHHVAGMISAPG